MQLETPPKSGSDAARMIIITVDPALISEEALLKTSYWFSRDFVCEMHKLKDGKCEVHLTPRPGVSAESAHGDFVASANDFALRERIETRTAGVRDLLLAKAFSESGVLEEEPQGKFDDTVEGSKPDGMFKILSNSVRASSI
jgi:His-Xaa-Ser system protein HxsD